MSTPPSLPSRPSSPAAVPSPAGIYDYLLRGDHHSAADREAAKKALAIAPEARFAALENRAFLQRAVHYAAERGVRQYVDVGSGFPTAGPVHEIAGEVVGDPHVVYVDYDPAVARLSRTLLRSANVVTVAHDLRRPWHIIDDPEVARLIDWSESVAVLMAAILHFVTDDENPAEIIATFRDHMVPGSYLILSHGSHGENPDAVEEAARAWDSATSSLTLRTPTAIEDLFTGFELVPPGLVTTTEWGTAEPAPTGQGLILAGVGRVP
jgi:O-methyltransferase involved in polyketide biosynthesis